MSQIELMIVAIAILIAALCLHVILSLLNKPYPTEKVLKDNDYTIRQIMPNKGDK